MGRVHHHHAPAGTSGSVGLVHHKRTEPKEKPTYKVVLEEIAGKKKLKTMLSLRERPPTGYTFIPAGDPQLTNRCKKLAKDAQLTVFIVSTSKHPHEQLSTEVHRIGYHFPSIIVDQACTSLGVTLTQSGRVLQSRFAFIDDQGDGNEYQGRRPTKGKGKGKNRKSSPKLDMSLSQAVIDTTAREAIKDLFPNIPLKDQKEIVGRAFQKGKGLVGTVSGLSLVRRAQLAVTAHIRHTYTNYDILLKSMRWGEARQAVQKACLDRLVQWRGDDDDDGEMADILQEVIVISDDEEDEDQNCVDSLEARHERSSSVEFVSADRINTKAIDYSARGSGASPGRSLSPDRLDTNTAIYSSETSLFRHPPVHDNSHRNRQRGVDRYRMWEEAIERQRRNPEVLSAATDGRRQSPGPRNLGPDHYQEQLETRPQAYGLDSAAHTDRRSTYTRLIPLPRLNDPSHHGPESRGIEQHVLANQVSYSLQEQHPYSPRSLGEPYRVLDARGNNQPRHERLSYGTQPLRVRTEYEDAKSVTSQKSKSDQQHIFQSRPFESPIRQQPEIILPSIEGDLANVGVRRRPSPSQHQQPGILPLQRTYVAEREEPHVKRRRIDDEHSSNDHQARSVLIPLSRGAKDRARMTTGPAEAMYYENVPSFTLDKRMIQLPARENRRYEDSERRIQVMNHDKHVENRLVPQSLGEESQLGLVDREIPVQPHSPKRPVYFQSVYDMPSPHTLNPSTLPYREVLEQPSTAGVKGSTPRVSDSAAFIGRSQRCDDAGREVGADFRNLAINPRTSHDYEIDDHMVMDNRGDPPYASSIIHFSPRPHKDMPMAGREDHRQFPTYSNSLEPGQRCDLRNDIVAFGHPRSTDPSSRGEQQKFRTPYMHGGNGVVPLTKGSYTYAENENIRLPLPPERKSSQSRSRAPGAIVVLD